MSFLCHQNDGYSGKGTAMQVGYIPFEKNKYHTTSFQESGTRRTFGIIQNSAGNRTLEQFAPPTAMDDCVINQEDIENNSEEGWTWNAMMHPFLRHTIKGLIMYLGKIRKNLKLKIPLLKVKNR